MVRTSRFTEDDLFLVAIDTQHHGSHDRTVFEENTSQDRCEKDSNFCWLPSGNSSEIRVLWKEGNPFVGVPLRVLEVSQHSCGLCVEEVALFVRLDGEHHRPVTSFFGLTFLMSMRSKKFQSFGIVIKLQTSCCSPVSVTEQNNPAAAAYLCLWASLFSTHHQSER